VRLRIIRKTLDPASQYFDRLGLSTLITIELKESKPNLPLLSRWKSTAKRLNQ
jgi:hypothetical protein